MKMGYVNTSLRLAVLPCLIKKEPVLLLRIKVGALKVQELPSGRCAACLGCSSQGQAIPFILQL